MNTKTDTQVVSKPRTSVRKKKKPQTKKKGTRPVYFSSKTWEWSTPLWLFWLLDYLFGFTLDPCSTPANALCSTYYTLIDDGLKQSWRDHIVFMNPPYDRRSSGIWIERAWRAARDENATVVCLVPARTDTKWWENFVTYGHVIFLPGRLKFGGAKHGAPFPSALVIFGPKTIAVGPQKKMMSIKALMSLLPLQIAIAKALIGTPSGPTWKARITAIKSKTSQKA